MSPAQLAAAGLALNAVTASLLALLDAVARTVLTRLGEL